MSIKILSYDLETSGLNPQKNAIHQLAFRMYVDFKMVKEVMVDIKPFPNDEIEDKALEVSNKTREMVFSDSHVAPQLVYKAIIKALSEHCDKFNKQDKFFLLGYNNQSFDNEFLRSFFAKNGDNYFGSWFWSHGLDVMILASQDIMLKRNTMPNFQLGTVGKEYGLDVDEKGLHNAYFDLNVHEGIYEKITGIKFDRS